MAAACKKIEERRRKKQAVAFVCSISNRTAREVGRRRKRSVGRPSQPAATGKDRATDRPRVDHLSSYCTKDRSRSVAMFRYQIIPQYCTCPGLSECTNTISIEPLEKAIIFEKPEKLRELWQARTKATFVLSTFKLHSSRPAGVARSYVELVFTSWTAKVRRDDVVFLTFGRRKFII